MPEVAFDTSTEMEEYVMRVGIQLRLLQDNGRADAQERFSGVHWEPGHRDHAETRRLERKSALGRNKVKRSRVRKRD